MLFSPSSLSRGAFCLVSPAQPCRVCTFGNVGHVTFASTLNLAGLYRRKPLPYGSGGIERLCCLGKGKPFSPSSVGRNILLCFCRDLGSKFCLLKERRGPVLFVSRQPCCTRELFAPPGWCLFILGFRTPEASTHTPVKTLGVWCQVLALGLTRKSSSV